MRAPPDDHGGPKVGDALRARLARTAAAARKWTRLSRRETAEILEARARALASPAPTGSAADRKLELVSFTLGGERLAIEMQYVRAVDRESAITPLPNVPDYVLGVTSFRGEVVAIFDVRAALTGPRRPTERSRLLFLGRRGIEFAIVADSVDEVVQVAAHSVVRRPWTLAGQVAGGATADALNVLDGAALLDDEIFFIGDGRTGPANPGGET